MKIKFIKEYTLDGQVLPVDSVIEIEDQALVDTLTADGTAVLVPDDVIEQECACKTDEMTAKAVKDIEQKTISAPKAVAKEKHMKGLIKAISNTISTKAATDYSATTSTEILGIVGQDAQVYGLTSKRTVKGNLKIVYSNVNSNADAPVIGIVGESTGAGTACTLAEYDAIPAKWIATVNIPSEMVDDVENMEAFVTKELGNKLNLVLDNSVLNGPFTQNKGFNGIVNDANTAIAVIADLDAPKADELLAMTAKINPALLPNCKWVVSPKGWSAICGELLTAENIGNQLIQAGKTPMLLGFDVVISMAVPAATPMVFGDFGQYVSGVARDIRVEVDPSASFLTDEVAVKISGRFAGGLACGIQTYAGAEYAGMVYASESEYGV